MRLLLLLLISGCPAQQTAPLPEAGNARPDAGPIRLDASIVLLPGGGESAEEAALSCETAQAENGEASSGVYWINPIGGSVSNAFRVYCDFGAEDGPWTLVLRVDGSVATFKYDAPIWSNNTLLNEDALEPGAGEMKNAGYNLLPYTALRLGMRVSDEEEEGDGEMHYLSFQASGSSLRQTMVRGNERETSLGREAWRSLIPVTSLQDNCNAEGINIRHKLRFGLLGNEQDDCNSPDSFIGIGSTREVVISGNFAVGRYGSDNGDRRTRAEAEVWLQFIERGTLP
jgi:hypothetical protein